MMDWNNNNITDEMLAAYIDGNATPMESALIADTMMHDDMLAETIDIVNDSLSMGNDLFGNNDLYGNGMSFGLEDWFPSTGMDSGYTLPDAYSSMDGNNGLTPYSNDNDLMNNSLDLTNNDY